MRQQGNGLPVYIGRYNLHGYGLGGTLISNIFKQAIPILKPIAKSIFKRVKDEAIRTGRDIAQDVIVNKVSAKKAIRNRAKESFKRMLQGSTNQSGSGKRRKQTNRRGKTHPTTIQDIFEKQGKRKPSHKNEKNRPRKRRKTQDGTT